MFFFYFQSQKKNEQNGTTKKQLSRFRMAAERDDDGGVGMVWNLIWWHNRNAYWKRKECESFHICHGIVLNIWWENSNFHDNFFFFAVFSLPFLSSQQALKIPMHFMTGFQGFFFSWKKTGRQMIGVSYNGKFFLFFFFLFRIFCTGFSFSLKIHLTLSSNFF